MSPSNARHANINPAMMLSIPLKIYITFPPDFSLPKLFQHGALPGAIAGGKSENKGDKDGIIVLF